MSGDLLNLTVQKPDDKSPVTNQTAGSTEFGKGNNGRSSNVSLNTASSVEHSNGSGKNEKQHFDSNAQISSSSSRDHNKVTAENSTRSSDISPVSLSIKSSHSVIAMPFTTIQSAVCLSSGAAVGQRRSPSKSSSRHGQSRSRTTTDRSSSRSQKQSDWPKHAGDVRNSCNSPIASGSSFCQPVIAAAQSQGIGFPVAARLTATVAPSPVRFNVPVIVPQPSVAGYLAAAARPPHHAYYPYAAAQNMFAYPVAGYPATAHSYGSSTVASWSGLQDISQFSYQPGLAAASLCSAGAGQRGVLQQQHLQHQQATQFFRPCFQQIAQAHQQQQQQQYPNLQPAHSSLALYPSRFGLVTSNDVVMPSAQMSDSAAAKVYDPRTYPGIPSVGVLPVQPSTVPPTQFTSLTSSSPASKSKRPSTSSSSNVNYRNNVSPATPVSSQCNRNSLLVPTAREVVSCSSSDSSSPLVKSYYVLGNDHRSATVVTESTIVTAPTIIQPFGIYAGCMTAPFNVAGMSPGQTSQGMNLGRFTS